jgi:hypothetical protein
MRTGGLSPPRYQCKYLAGTGALTGLLCLSGISPRGVALAVAANPDVVVEHVKDMGIFKGRHYLQVEGLMVGRFTRADGSSGRYRVPLIMAFPARDG